MRIITTVILLITCHLTYGQIEGRYLNSDGFTSTLITLKKDGIYEIKYGFCTGSITNQGIYTVANDHEQTIHLLPIYPKLNLISEKKKELKDSVYFTIDSGITNIGSVYINIEKDMEMIYYGTQKDGQPKTNKYVKAFDKGKIKTIELRYFNNKTEQGDTTIRKTIPIKHNHIRIMSLEVYQTQLVGDLILKGDTMYTFNRKKYGLTEMKFRRIK